MTDKSYSIESELDKAFPYLDSLEEEINTLKNVIEKRKLAAEARNIIKKEKINLFGIFKLSKNKNIAKVTDKPKKLRRKTLKHHNFIKDGYKFLTRIVIIYEDNPNYADYYEFSVAIKFGEQIRDKQFYKKIATKDDALKYYENMNGIFKHLTRRDLMERLFKEKKQEIEYYKNQF